MTAIFKWSFYMHIFIGTFRGFLALCDGKRNLNRDWDKGWELKYDGTGTRTKDRD